MGQQVDYSGIPPWLRHFLVHVVKRCIMIWVAWINEIEKEAKKER